ncbi:VOC family protein [Arthrobacter sp. I2-34]|uniref:VOC family protein n=1 Tax=Arthrobacter hankyongi TaxID=2904801 RepID=A0ABS9LA78_9MICC|nr:VOC family protein [Arthrobacter hankyongi]MCG2623591.1 VOC family protein [Arthrobacter hankyongi]
MRIKMCSIHVKDPAEAFTFYTQILGFEELMAMPDYNLYIVKSPDEAPGAGLLLEPSDNPLGEAYRQGVYDAGLPAIVFGVPDVQAEYERLSGLGVKFTAEPAPDPSGAVAAVLDDGCGNLVQLHQD